jgi:hypothetical protein
VTEQAGQQKSGKKRTVQAVDIHSTLSSIRDNIKKRTVIRTSKQEEQPGPTHQDRRTGCTQKQAITACSTKEVIVSTTYQKGVTSFGTLTLQHDQADLFSPPASPPPAASQHHAYTVLPLD